MIPLKRLKSEWNQGLKHENVATDWMKDVVVWLENTIAKPTPHIKRKGAICPFVPKALDIDSIYLTFPKENMEDISQLVEYMIHCMNEFLQTAPTIPDESAIYKSFIVAFPYLNESNSSMLKTLRKEIKPYFIRNGVTCGEFFERNVDKSVRNEEFDVAKSPVPLIAIRYVTPHDELFLKSQPELYKVFKEWRDKIENA
ncbi:hypothetical protein U0X36_04975 [Bacillus thuringiensis]|uniref:DUF6875 domain-containing protein n=1 Tax=Bacillus thuringiensis TaxID=1428 RepID=UPI000E49EC2A|nr:hypothetical protein [Bacillus thuringiensis]MDZ3952304.1 hypothetical protein [Bacillus thuringiensis]RGP42667.1 hypothetical protein BTW32_30695 [Bacillus thuringiensis]